MKEIESAKGLMESAIYLFIVVIDKKIGDIVKRCKEEDGTLYIGFNLSKGNELFCSSYQFKQSVLDLVEEDMFIKYIDYNKKSIYKIVKSSSGNEIWKVLTF